MACGTALSDDAPSSGPAEEECRRITVMFADIVGSTALSEELDPEDLRNLVTAFQCVVADEVRSRGGHVAQHLGDGVLVYFGYPIAHEDSTRRCIEAGLAVLVGLKSLNRRFELSLGRRIGVRIGLHTGDVVVGAMGGDHSERLAIGQAPNVAARIQSLADENAVLISETTADEVRGEFEWASIGRRTLRGVSKPLEVFRIVAATDARDRLDPARGRQLVPFLGRQEELAQLARGFEATTAGTGTCALLRGEAGIGKTRLVLQFAETLRNQDHRWLHLRCRPETEGTPLAVFTNNADTLFELDGSAPTAGLQRFAHRWDLDEEHLLALIGPLVGVPAEQIPALNASPQVRRRLLFEVLTAAVTRPSEERPTVLCVEDLHWADPSTTEMLETFPELSSQARMFLVATARPDFDAPALGRCAVDLSRISNDDVVQITRAIAGGKELPEFVVRSVVERADGNPLFAEELTRTLLESGQLVENDAAFDPTSRSPLRVPTTLKGSLVARLDRMAPARAVVLTAAAIGRDAPYELLARAGDLQTDDLDRELANLVAAGLLYQTGVGRKSTFTFSHALVRDAAYEGLTRNARAGYHARVANALQSAFPDTRPEVLAYHLEEAGSPNEALEKWYAAAQAALGSFALRESKAHHERALSLLDSIKDTRSRNATELRVRMTYGVPLALTEGFAAASVLQHYERQRTLSESAGAEAAPFLLPALFGLWTFYTVSGQWHRSFEMGERMTRFAQEIGDDSMWLAAHIGRGGACMMLGNLLEARDHFTEALKLYRMDDHAKLAMLFGQDGGAMSAVFQSWTCELLGDVERTAQGVHRAIQLTETLRQPNTEGFVRTCLGMLATLKGRWHEAMSHADRVIVLAKQEGMPHWEAQATAMRGCALAGMGQCAEAKLLLRAGLEQLEAIGSTSAFSFFFIGVVRAHLGLGEFNEALGALDTWEAYRQRTGEHILDTAMLDLRAKAQELLGEAPEVVAATRLRSEQTAERQAVQFRLAL